MELGWASWPQLDTSIGIIFLWASLFRVKVCAALHGED